MQDIDQPMPTERVIPLAYAREAAPASEMVWIVRFIAVYIFVQALSQLIPSLPMLRDLANNIARPSLIVLWKMGAIFGLGTICTMTLIAIAMWCLRREAFWALLILCTGPHEAMRWGIHTWLPFMPAAMMTVAVVFLIYRRAIVREALRLPALAEVPPVPATTDMTWFMSIIGLWALIPAVSCLIKWVILPITGLYGFAFRDFIATNCVNIAVAILMTGIGAILIARRSYRVLPPLAGTLLLAGVGGDVAIRWDLSHNSMFITKPTLSSYPGSVYGVMMCALTLVLYRRARQQALCRASHNAALNAV